MLATAIGHGAALPLCLVNESKMYNSFIAIVCLSVSELPFANTMTAIFHLRYYLSVYKAVLVAHASPFSFIYGS